MTNASPPRGGVWTRPVTAPRTVPLPATSSLERSLMPARTRAVMAHESYRRADRDPDLLQRRELRGLRLQLEYTKAELTLEEAGIEHTLVVFGGTRVTEPAAAERRVEWLRAAVAERPDDVDLARKLASAERLVELSRFYDVARELGALVGRAGHGRPPDERLVICTGGGPGLMEAANRGARDVGAATVGLNITLPGEQLPNEQVTPGLCLQFRYFALRKLHFAYRARGLVVFPGGYGTLDELFEILCLIQTEKMRRLPVVLVGESFWRRCVDLEMLAEEGLIDPEDLLLVEYADSAPGIWSAILAAYPEARDRFR